MKKILISVVAVMCCFWCTVGAMKLEEKDIVSSQNIGDVLAVKVKDAGDYIVDLEGNVISGPFEYVSSYSGFPLAQKQDGARELYDIDGTLLVSAGAKGEVYPPANGLYAVSPTVKSMNEIGEFIIYDYQTRKEIGRTYKPFFYYLEQQNEKMFIDRDGKYAIIDKFGNYLTDFIYDDVKKRFNPDYEPYPEAYAIVVSDGVEKYIDWELNEIDISNYNGGRFITQFYHMNYNYENYKEFYHAESGDFHAIYNGEKGEFLIPFQNEFSFKEMNDEYIIITKNEKYGIMDYNENVIVEPIYDTLDFTELEGFLGYRRGEVTGYFDVERLMEVSDFQGQLAGNGVILHSYYDYSGEYRKYCTEIKNFAGHNLTGDIYRFAEYKDGVYTNIESYDPYKAVPVEFDSGFTVINLNGKYLDFDGTIRESRTLVPMREIVEGLGGEVLWDSDSFTATAKIDGKTISMSIGNNVITVDDTEVVIDVPAQLINEKTMLPVRALCENLGADVGWDERIRCVYIVR